MAEKYSKFRDPGTGIQVFLTPVSASMTSTTGSSSSFFSSSSLSGVILTPIFVLVGVVRAAVGAVFWGMYLVSGKSALLRVVLGALGFISLPIESFSPVTGSGRSRSGNNLAKHAAVQQAKGGDLIMANHSSYFDLLILTWLYPGLKFVLPVIDDEGVKREEKMGKKDTTVGVDVGTRRRPKNNAMSANTRIVTPSSSSYSSTSSNSTEIPILGYVILPLPKALRFIGSLPPCRSQLPSNFTLHKDLDSTIKSSSSISSSCPLAFFPEIVTSNNRALLTVPNLPSTPPPSLKTTHIVTLKYGPPTGTSTTSIYSAPSKTNSLMRHLTDVLFLSNPVRRVTVRQTTTVAEQEAQDWPEDVVGLMSTMARLKRTSIDWWTKNEFLLIVRARNRRV